MVVSNSWVLQWGLLRPALSSIISRRDGFFPQAFTMKRAAVSSGFPIDLNRIDLVDGDFEISQRIMDEIDASDIVLADFTLNPSNVYFELGYARGQKRRIIQTARKGTILEFDVRNWKTIFYRNATELEVALKSAFIEAYSDVTRGSA